MNLSVTAVTRNRALSKALIRAAAAVSEIKAQFASAHCGPESFDTLQLVLVDSPPGHSRHAGTRNDRLYQIEVGFGGGYEEALGQNLRRSIIALIPSLPVSPSTMAALSRVMERHRITERDASPNGGPTERFDNSALGGGPPSVS